MDPDGSGWTQDQEDRDIPRQTRGSHEFQMVMPDFGTNGSLESEDIRTFFVYLSNLHIASN